MEGIVIGRVLFFFSFEFDNQRFPCALVNRFVPDGDGLDAM